MNSFGREKVTSLEQAMALVSCHTGRDVKGSDCCSQICTVLARCPVLYLHVRVYMLLSVFMLKPTFRYIELVNYLFCMTVVQTIEILLVSQAA